MEDFFIESTMAYNKFALLVDNTDWLKDVRSRQSGHDLVKTFNTERQALQEINFIKQSYPSLDLKVVPVEEEIYIDSRENIIRQVIREL